MVRFTFSLLIRMSASLLVVLSAASLRADEDLEFFEARIRPVLVQKCYECHSSVSADVKGGLRLDSREALRRGGESGPGLVPGQPDDSLILEALRYESFEMPPDGKLADRVVKDFEHWIRDGAVDPRDQPPAPHDVAEMTWKAQLAERSRWWSLQPLRVVRPPDVPTSGDAGAETRRWAQSGIDRFVLAKLRESGLSPAPSADADTLLRRLSFVLTGLPPAPQRVLQFRADYTSHPEAALAQLVEELLASPHFGERFARHWMDVVRYTDTYGYEWDNPAKGSWEYRDYLIRAFNNDVGFDQLIREQLAGDLLPEPRLDEAGQVNESLIGPMFYHLGEHRHGTSLEFNGIHQEMVNNKIDAFSKAFLGMTVACARCHDHKLDAISQADYYALAGVFMTPRWTARVVDAPGSQRGPLSELKRLRSQIRDALASRWTSRRVESWSERLQAWAAAQPETKPEARLDDPSYPLLRLASIADGADGASIVDTWQALAQQWRAERARRIEANATQFEVLSDFREPGLPAGWVAEGAGIREGYVRDGTPLVALEGEALIARLLPRGYHTHALSSKLAGAVRLPPQDQIPGRFVSLQLQGGEWAGYLVVPQNAFQTESVTFLDPAAPRTWTAISDSPLNNGVTRVLVEVATAALNPNFPPRTGKARAGKVTLPPQDDGLQKRSWFSLTGIVAHETGGAPQDELALFEPLYCSLNPTGDREASAVPETLDAAWQRAAEWVTGALRRWDSDDCTSGDVRLLNWLITQKLLANDPAAFPDIADLVRRYREIESRIADARTVNSMDERQLAPIDYRLNIRGNVDDEGPAIPRDFLEVFAGEHDVALSLRSGRRELAEYLSSSENPLTARVYVNRVWQWVFGTGIVATPSDFGKLGDRPSHPALLDWLAARFMADGWSTKTLVRQLVLSQTFRQSSFVTEAAVERDPENRLLHHYPTRRLEAEAIRDSMLAVSGRLDHTLYGPPINPPRTVEDPAKRLFSGPLDGDGRRAVYLKMAIMDPPKFLVCFNLPDLKLPTGRRDVTNVPAQALALLNDPLVTELADRWAHRVLHDGCQTPEERVQQMFLRALGRLPVRHELHRWTGAVRSFSSSEDLMSDSRAWAELAHAFFNVKEFLYYR